MITFAIAASLASTTPVAPPSVSAVPNTDPALWVVSDEDTTVYLFGTFHALDGKSDWFNDHIRTAFNASDELVLETLIPDAPATVSRRRVQRMAAQPIRPGASFLASTRLALSVGKSKGLSFDHGADAVLRNAARFYGKKVSGLESFEFQLGMFARLRPEGLSTARPGQAVNPLENLATVMATMQASWNRGEGEIFAGMLDEMRRRTPETYQILFLERNARWAEWISKRLETPGTVFLAVGAGHLAGSDSVQNKLALLGVQSARVQ